MQVAVVAEHNITYETPTQKRKREAAARDAQYAEMKARVKALAEGA